MTPARPGEGGFALAAIAVALAAVGGLMVLAAALEPARGAAREARAAERRLDRVSDAIVAYAVLRKSLPCPAGAPCEAGAGGVPWRALALPARIAETAAGPLVYRVAAAPDGAPAWTAAGALLALDGGADGPAFALVAPDGRERTMSLAALARATRIAGRRAN